MEGSALSSAHFHQQLQCLIHSLTAAFVLCCCRYDLKGSTRGRVTSETEREDPHVVLKDLDWIRAGRKLHLGADKKRRLLAQIKKDCALLERLEVSSA